MYNSGLYLLLLHSQTFHSYYSHAACFCLFVLCVCVCVCVCVCEGLAVGDTAEERDKAMFTRTRLQVEFILELEATSSFLRGLMRPPDNRRHYWKKVCA